MRIAVCKLRQQWFSHLVMALSLLWINLASCISEITRIIASKKPSSYLIMNEAFQLIVENIRGLDHFNSPLFVKRVTILETFAKFKFGYFMLDIVCKEMIFVMFQIF